MTVIEFYLIGAFIVGWFSGFGAAILAGFGVYKIIKAGKAAKNDQ